MRLTKKFAELTDRIDLSRVHAGEEVVLSARDVRILIAEGWAQPAAIDGKAVAADKEPARRSRRRS